jgi:hypothetical protein
MDPSRPFSASRFCGKGRCGAVAAAAGGDAPLRRAVEDRRDAGEPVKSTGGIMGTRIVGPDDTDGQMPTAKDEKQKAARSGRPGE